MYQAPSTTPTTARTASERYQACQAGETPPQARWKEPARIRNSPTKPFKPGRPMLENVNSMKNTVSHGALAAIPPRLAMLRVWNRS